MFIIWAAASSGLTNPTDDVQAKKNVPVRTNAPKRSVRLWWIAAYGLLWMIGRKNQNSRRKRQPAWKDGTARKAFIRSATKKVRNVPMR